MKATTSHRIIAGALTASLAIGSLAPAAFADHGRGGPAPGYVQRAGYPTRYSVEHQSSSIVPAVAGFLGGLAVGTILSNHSDGVAVQAGYSNRGYGYGGGYGYARGGYGGGDNCATGAYYYVDPWNGDRYADLTDYRTRCTGHWPIAQVIDVRSNSYVQTVCWHDGRWQNYDTSDPPWRHDNGNRGGWSNGNRRGDWNNGGDRGDWNDGNGRGHWKGGRGHGHGHWNDD